MSLSFPSYRPWDLSIQAWLSRWCQWLALDCGIHYFYFIINVFPGRWITGMLPVLWNYIIVKINISLSQDAHMGDCQHDCQHVKKVDATVEPTPFQKSFFFPFYVFMESRLRLLHCFIICHVIILDTWRRGQVQHNNHRLPHVCGWLWGGRAKCYFALQPPKRHVCASGNWSLHATGPPPWRAGALGGKDIADFV